jgi:hypothetical protein
MSDISKQADIWKLISDISLDRFPLLHPLGHGAQVRSGDLHGLEFACCRVKYALFDQVYLPVAACGAQRVASGVSEGGLFAGFLTDTCHKVARG